MERDGFLFYRSYYDAIKELPAEDKAAVYDAIMEFALYHHEVKVTGTAKVVMTLVKPLLEANCKRYMNGKTPKVKASVKQDGSKSEANAKQTPSKHEANTEQSASKPEGKDKDKEKDKEESKDKEETKEDKDSKDIVSLDAHAVIDHFNQRLGTNYRYSKTAMTPIMARLGDGYTVDQCNGVIDKKCVDWAEDAKMAKYLTIETLFRPGNFEKYLNQVQAAPKEDYFMRVAREGTNAGSGNSKDSGNQASGIFNPF
jgi:uncharacterized phage protein (TIGR02220 family)